VDLGPTPKWGEYVAGCGYTEGRAWGNSCGGTPVLHMILRDGQGFAAACDRHIPAAVEALDPLDKHDWGVWCDTPGAMWMGDPSRCELDGSGERPVQIRQLEVVT
jgi:hypothetical protein